MKIYEIQNNGETVEAYGLFQHRRTAQGKIDGLNYSFINRKLVEVNKLTGIKRGKNVEAFKGIVGEVAKPPYTIREREVVAYDHRGRW